MKNWLMFLGLGGIWGSSFLLIKVGVKDLGPLPLVSVRIGLAALLMFAFLRLTGRAWPAERREVAAIVFVGVMNTAVPFSLITWGEQKIDSGLATVLDATVPLFTLVFAHFALSDERITPQKVIGLGTGFLGVALLASRQAASSSPNPFSGQFAVLLASACYALSVVVIRRYLRRVDPFVVAGGSLMVGGVVIVLITLITASLPALGDLHTKAVLAVLVLAVMNTVVAYFLFYHLISTWGATRTTLVTYIMPPVGVTLGAIFLDETVDWKIVAGAALILGGILAVNWRGRTRLAPAAGEPVDSALVETD
ncbi:MAG TPA: EamA family transporter [Aggregatilineaceae bacterium]|nr:EamA family transporter [Aggregatilineaceae bacterium]